MVSLPEYLLISQTDVGNQPGRWRFVLRRADGTPPLEVDDVDPNTRGERLELLSVVLGLEALDQPSRVVLLTRSVYVREGLRYGLHDWPKHDWQWESFGKMVPVKNRDLWQRIERALRFHQVECRTWRIDRAHQRLPVPHVQGRFGRPSGAPAEQSEADSGIKPRLRRFLRRSWPRISVAGRGLERVACL